MKEKKIKIAMFGHKRIPSRAGGVEIVVEELSARMAAMGHAVICYNRGGEDRTQYRGIQIKAVPTIRRKGFGAVISSFFAAVCVAFSTADVCHIHAEGPAFMSFLPKLFGKRVIVTVHGLDWQREKWGSFGAAFIRMGEKMAVRFADEIIVLSLHTQSYFLDRYERKTVFLPNGVTKFEKYPPRQIINQFGLQRGDYLLYLGRLVPEKGVHDLINAFKGVRTDKKLVIAGASSDTDEYVQSLKALSSGNSRIRFTGFVAGRLLAELFSNAYLYVLPSHLEGMPLSLLEAMSYGCCCVVSDIPECTEVVEDHAAIFPKGDVQALRHTLQTFCDDAKQVSRYRRQAEDFLRGKSDWDEVTKKTLELYYENSARP